MIRTRPLHCLVALLVGGALLAVAAPSDAQAAPRAEPVAILDPFLKTLIAGTPVGAGLACQAATGTINAASSSLGPQVASVASALTDQISTACAQFGAQNAAALKAFQSQIGPLAAINPSVNPGIELFAKSMRDTGKGMGTLLFGETVSQLGDLIAFYGTGSVAP